MTIEIPDRVRNSFGDLIEDKEWETALLYVWREAVASERERCARIAIDHFKGDPYYSEMGLAVARAIEQEPKP